jgi:pimeloyl-ACP methyl ester carboxylesterase
MAFPSSELRLPDGRCLEYTVAGPGDGALLVSHHGTPSAGRLFEPFVAAGAARGLRTLTYSRPGYATSTRAEGRSVAACADDVAALADHLGVERFLVTGRSGGGPHALACAARMPERVIACATVASVAPWGAEGLAFLDGMAEENVEEFAATQAGPDELEAYLRPMAERILRAGPRTLADELGDLISEVDAGALDGGYGDFAAGMLHDGVRDGIWGWFDDDRALTGTWGFGLDEIAVPVTVWQGGRDHAVPFAHGAWLAAHLPGARAEPHPEHGHLSLAVARYGEILDDLTDPRKEHP